MGAGGEQGRLYGCTERIGDRRIGQGTGKETERIDRGQEGKVR